jgi:tRNA threonylcarbamoyladenosine modification (KEOPS) complex  Pcc1 subunit
MLISDLCVLSLLNSGINKNENSIIFQINSKDITAFRASVNEIITFGKIVDNCFYLIEKF